MTTWEIIMAEGNGDFTIEEANKKLKEIGSNVQLVNGKNEISPAEAAEAVVSDDPAKVCGWGHMAHGIGSPEKMHVKNGKFEYDTGFEKSKGVIFMIKDKKYRVVADHIEKI